MAKGAAYSLRNDIFLFACIGAVSYFVSKSIHKQLLLFRDANRIRQPDKSPDLVGRETEDSVKVPTLDTLIQEHTSREVKNAAIKLGVDRFLRDPHAYNALLQDVMSKDAQRQESALRALRYLYTNPHIHEAAPSTIQKLTSPKTFSALITCLCNFLPSPSTQSTDGANSAPLLRPSQPEADALRLVNGLAGPQLNVALRAGLVSRWLKNYPLGNAPAQRIRDIVRDDAEDTDLSFVEILRTLLSNPEGERAMRAAGLVGSSMGDEADDKPAHESGRRQPFGRQTTLTADGIFHMEDDVIGTLPEGTEDYIRRATIGDNLPSPEGPTVFDDPDHPATMAAVRQDLAALRDSNVMDDPVRLRRMQRLLMQMRDLRLGQRERNNPEQAAVRRRRREAMVFHEGESPVSREDIFQRRMTGDALGPETGEAIQHASTTAAEQRDAGRQEQNRPRGGGRASPQGEDDEAAVQPARWADLMRALGEGASSVEQQRWRRMSRTVDDHS